MSPNLVQAEMPPPPPEGKAGAWHPDMGSQRWHYYIAGEHLGVCGKPFRFYRVNGVLAPVTPETVSFRAKCTRCERALAVVLGTTINLRE